MQHTHYLTPDQLKELGDDLRNSLREREHVNELSMKEATGEHDKITDASDQGTQYENQNNSLALGHHASEQCKVLRRALNFFEKEPDDYGYCKEPTCGEEIGFKRLKANPAARYCIDCQSLEEAKNR